MSKSYILDSPEKVALAYLMANGYWVESRLYNPDAPHKEFNIPHVLSFEELDKLIKMRQNWTTPIQTNEEEENERT